MESTHIFAAVAIVGAIIYVRHKRIASSQVEKSQGVAVASLKKTKEVEIYVKQLSFSLEELKVFTNAVGGHSVKKRGPAMLQAHGVILKAFQDHGDVEDEPERKRKRRGELEAEFYAKVHATEHPIKSHQPQYYGVQTLADGNKYLVLEDLTCGLGQPCVLDLKMGRKSYDEDATPDKIAKEKAKYPPQEVIGFRFSGMKVYQPATGDWVLSTRDWCLSLEPRMIPDALERFFFDGRSVRRHLIRSVVEQVGSIAKCLEDHPTWRMYGASLLIIYDGASAENKVITKLIDFSHCYEIKDSGGKDYGFLHGLYFLLSSLNEVLDRGRRNVTRRGSLVDSATRLIAQSAERASDDTSEPSSTPAQNYRSLATEPIVPAGQPAEAAFELLQQDPHLAPVVRKRLISGEEESRRLMKQRSKSMQDVLFQANTSGEDSPLSLGSSHQRSPSSNAAFPVFKSSSSEKPRPAEHKTSKRRLERLDSSSARNVMDQSPLRLSSRTLTKDSSTRNGLMAGEPTEESQIVERVKAQIGGAHDNIFEIEGRIEKEEIDTESFENEVRFYQLIADDSLKKVVPTFIRVDEQSKPRKLVLEDVSTLVPQDIPAALDMAPTSERHPSMDTVNIMDIKLGFRSFRADVSNEPKSTYYEKYVECIKDFDSGYCSDVWTRLTGDPKGPASLKKKLLGKKDYLLFRDGTTTSSEYGFRLTALKHFDFKMTQEDAKTKVKTYDDFASILERFLSSGPNGFNSELADNFIEELDTILEAISTSEIFEQGDFVGTSLLFVHRGGIPAVRWIDFANVTDKSSEDRNGIVYGIKKIRSVLENLIYKPKIDI